MTMVISIKLIFWLSLFIVFYAYVGYGIVLFAMIKIKRLFGKSPKNTDAPKDEDWPKVTFVVAAYNEEDWIINKIKNCLEFDYPKNKIEYLFVTDGTSDRTPQLIEAYESPADVKIRLYHKDERKGKIAAVERIMKFVETPIVIYTDANTFVNKQAIKKIVRHYKNPKVGGVAGEKRIELGEKDAANSAGEGIYWKYESILKKWDSELNSVVGAAGELFSIRTELFEAVAPDTIIEDFYMTLRVAQKGYKMVYEPEAYAVETSSASVGEELKRKIRIAAGGIQAIIRLAPLLNIFKYGLLSFQYISHRVLRWTLAPLALPIIFFLNIYLAQSGDFLYQFLLTGQILFYSLALIGFILEKQKIKFKAFFVPYYFCIMNYAVFRGFFRIIGGNQSVIWDKAKRA